MRLCACALGVALPVRAMPGHGHGHGQARLGGCTSILAQDTGLHVREGVVEGLVLVVKHVHGIEQRVDLRKVRLRAIVPRGRRLRRAGD